MISPTFHRRLSEFVLKRSRDIIRGLAYLVFVDDDNNSEEELFVAYKNELFELLAKRVVSNSVFESAIRVLTTFAFIGLQ